MSQQTTRERSPQVSPLPWRGVLQRKCACGTHTVAGGECDACTKKQGAPQLQRSAISDESINEVPPIVHDVLRSSGQPLDAETRAFMEQRFGHDFSQVRVHSDAQAAESAKAVNALAYTVGSHVVFGAGQHAPQTTAGQQLLAHELTHTIQQSGVSSPLSGAPMIGASDSLFEREADNAAEGLSTGAHIASMTPGVASLQKKDPAKPEDLAGEALKAGPKNQTEKATYEKAEKDVAENEKKGTKITRVAIPTTGKDEGVRGVTESDYNTEAKKCKVKKQETGLPKAFLCTTTNITFPNVAPDDAAMSDTNVRVAFKPGASGGSIWVASANLPWELNTAGFLNIDVIDIKMLKLYEAHEMGHRTIAHQIRDHLAKLMQAELERVLPTEKQPLNKSGAKWKQDGLTAISKQISDIRTRYMNWFDELATAADSAWDAQEQVTLSKIATTLKAQGGHTPAVPDVPGE